MKGLFILENQFSSLLELYRIAAMGHPNKYSQLFWGEIPSSFEMIKKVMKKRSKFLDLKLFSDNVETFRQLVLERHRRLGTRTEQVKEALNRLDKGFLDVGHQPLLFGGPLFLINKLSLAESYQLLSAMPLHT